MYVDVNGYALRLLALSHGHLLRLLVTRPAVFHPLDICCFLLFALTPTLYLIIVVVVTIDITEKDEVAVSYGPLQGFKKTPSLVVFFFGAGFLDTFQQS